MTFPNSKPRRINLLEERLNRGLSPSAAAAEMGIARGSLNRAERGLEVAPRVAKAIADFYGYRVTEVWPLENAA